MKVLVLYVRYYDGGQDWSVVRFKMTATADLVWRVADGLPKDFDTEKWCEECEY